MRADEQTPEEAAAALGPISDGAVARVVALLSLAKQEAE